MFQDKSWIDGNNTPQSIGESLAALHPTLVSELIRIGNTTKFTSQMVNDYNIVRNIVLSSNPGVKFDIIISTQGYSTSAQIVNQMKYILSTIPIDIFVLDFLTQGEAQVPQIVQAAINYAHSQGKLITGHVTNASSVPPGLDYVEPETSGNLSLNYQLMNQLNHSYPDLPVLVEINQNPQTNGTSNYLGGFSASCYFIQEMSTQQRIDYVTSLAKNQSDYHYTYEYNVFFPTCPADSAYNPLADGNMLQVILQLMNEYNP